MTELKGAAKWLYRVYVSFGMLAMAAVVLGVIFSVIARYFFGVSYIFLEELLTLMFTFTTFWGVGACLLEDEHIIIGALVDRMKPHAKRLLDILNYILVLVINAMMVYYSIGWIQKAGSIVSNAMRIQYKFLYFVMPLGFAVGCLCTIVKLVLLCANKDVRFKPQSDSETDGMREM